MTALHKPSRHFVAWWAFSPHTIYWKKILSKWCLHRLSDYVRLLTFNWQTCYIFASKPPWKVAVGLQGMTVALFCVLTSNLLRTEHLNVFFSQISIILSSNLSNRNSLFMLVYTIHKFLSQKCIFRLIFLVYKSEHFFKNKVHKIFLYGYTRVDPELRGLLV